MEPQDNNRLDTVDNSHLPMHENMVQGFMQPQPSAGLSPVQATTQASTSTLPVVANDADLIEKEWVEAVKRVIRENKNDPYLQSKSMTQLREDYMKKRYGRDIKVSN